MDRNFHVDVLQVDSVNSLLETGIVKLVHFFVVILGSNALVFLITILFKFLELEIHKQIA